MHLAKVVAESQRRRSVVRLPEWMGRRMAKALQEGGLFTNQFEGFFRGLRR